MATIYNAELLVFKIFGKFEKIVFANAVTRKKHRRVLLVIHKPRKSIGKRFDHGSCAEITSAYACHNNSVAFFAQGCRAIFYGLQISLTY